MTRGSDARKEKMGSGKFKRYARVRLKSSHQLQRMIVIDNLTKDFPNETPLYECHWQVGKQWCMGRFPEHLLESDPGQPDTAGRNPEVQRGDRAHPTVPRG